jgi:hypothetical protein
MSKAKIWDGDFLTKEEVSTISSKKCEVDA